MTSRALLSSTVVLIALSPAAVGARDQIRIVGSSTVYPFATVVAEEFGRTTGFKTPIVESTGSGGGLKLFCAGVGVEQPDITNASRRIKASEVELCRKNGVDDITEIKLGYDGIVIANAKAAPAHPFTLRQLFLALAKQVPAPSGELIANPYEKWSDLEEKLPDSAIEILGPPPTSGTRDAFNELALEGGCRTFPEISARKDSSPDEYKRICHSIREDGGYVEAGENDNLIVQKLIANPTAFGVFGYSFLDQNTDSIRGNTIEGVSPTFDNIASGKYALSRPLYLYVKDAHVASIPGIREFLAEFTSEKAVGDFGYLSDKGLIPAPEAEREKYRAAARTLENAEALPHVAAQ